MAVSARARRLRDDGKVIDAMAAALGQATTGASARRIRTRSLGGDAEVISAVAASARSPGDDGHDQVLAASKRRVRGNGRATAATARRLRGDGRAAWPLFMARYERLEKLGVGINGEVYKAWDTEDEEIVAVKRLSGSGGGDLIVSGVREIARETMSLAACRGFPLLVQLRATLAEPHSEGDAFIVMEYVGRLNLRHYMQLRRRRPFSEAEVRRIMKQLLEGVRTVHHLGILHRDIKPENMLLDDGTEDRTRRPTEGAVAAEGRCKGKVHGRGKVPEIIYKIGGFGMSIPAPEEPGHEQPEVLILTGYSAPELLLRSREYGDRVDTWGLGCIMAELLAGTDAPLFNGDTDVEIRAKVFDVVGTKGITEWSGYKRLATDPAPLLPDRKTDGCLRKHFPSSKDARRAAREALSPEVGPALSSAGFEVLRGLLESNPEKRLSAAEALQLPWFKGSRRRFGGCLTSCVGGLLSEILD